MARSTKTQKALNLNAAHGLLSRGSSVAEAATMLAQERGISLRQAYRYLQRARALRRAMPVGEPSVPATFKIPRDVLAQLRAYSRRSGLPQHVGAEDMVKRSAERPAVCLEFAFDRLLPIKLQQAYGLLVANCVRPVGQDSEKRGDGREACSDLRQGLVGQTEGRTYHCEPNGSSARLRPTAGLQRAR